jgi:hypothetical protein
VFVLHYAHRHFGDGSGKPGIQFPGERPRLHGLRLSGLQRRRDVPGLGQQHPDLEAAQAGHRPRRRAYFYNTAILALGINIIAGLVGG